MLSRSYLLALAPVVFGIAGLACNGRTTTDESDSLSSKQKAGEAQKEEAANTNGQGVSVPNKSSASEPEASSCTYEYASSSSSSSGGDPATYTSSCESTDHYTCDAGEQEITCSCTSTNGQYAPGSCACNGITFAFDCNTGCSPGPAEYAKCNLPQPDDSGWGGGGSSGTSGSTSSSTSSSSGG